MGGMEYWTPLRDESRRYWQRVREQREAEERDRQAWIEDLKRRLRLIAIGSDKEGPPAKPEWPVLEEGARYENVPYKFVGMTPMIASRDCVNWYEKPEGMTTEEFFRSLP